tara:strand:- start:327 stop:836 length:510 start_codon:yes stop_codon:yes gene_type:complete
MTNNNLIDAVATFGKYETRKAKNGNDYIRIETNLPSGMRWMTVWSPTMQMILARQDATWSIKYVVTVLTNGKEGYTIKEASILEANAQPAPAPAPAPQNLPQSASVQLPVPVQAPDDRSLSIVRQVAFKEIPDKDSKSDDRLWELTNIYTEIILGTYESNEDEIYQQGF